MSTNTRFPEPPESFDPELKDYLSEFIRTLEGFDEEIFDESKGVVFEAARKRPVVEVSAAYSMGATESVILADATNGTFAVSLPAALDGQGTFYDIKRIDTNAAAVVSVEGSGSEMPVILQGNDRPSVTLYSDGSNFYII